MNETTQCLKTYKIQMPRTKFIGRCYHEADKYNGTFGHIWLKWFEQGLFEPIEEIAPKAGFIDEDGSYYGLCRLIGEESEYWIGMPAPEDAPVPEGYDSFILPACDGVVNLIYGKEPDIYTHCCLADMEKQGYSWDKTQDGMRIMTERYVRSRFNRPDEKGNIILDLVYYTNYR